MVKRPGLPRGVVLRDDFDLRARQIERKAGGVGGPSLVSIAQNRIGSWSKNNQLGYRTRYSPDANNRQTILKLDEWGPPEMWTISLGIETGFIDYDGFAIKAKIFFGAGGSTDVINVDWLNGTQISLPMNAVNIIAEFERVDAIADEGSGLFLTVQLARGARSSGDARTARCTLFDNLEIEPDTLETDPVAIPPYTSRICIVPTNQAGVIPVTMLSELYSNDFVVFMTADPTNLSAARVTNVVQGSNIDALMRGIDVTFGTRFIRFGLGVGAAEPVYIGAYAIVYG